MSVRLHKVTLQIQNFGNIMRKILKNRKAFAGLVLLLFFAFLAILGPFFVTDDPIAEGSASPGQMPVAARLCYPGWYQYVFGGNYTTNIYLTPDSQNAATDPGIYVLYNSSAGINGKGGLQVTFTRAGTATLAKAFAYPYQVPPPKFAIEWNYRVETQDPQTQEANLTVSFDFSYKIPGTDNTRVLPAASPLNVGVANSGWTKRPWDQSSSTSRALQVLYNGYDPASIIFSRPRTYTFDMVVQLSRNDTAHGGNVNAYGNTTLFLDNVEGVVFGNSFGLLGTDDLARDIFTQLVVGTRISFVIGIVSAVVSVGLGLIVGLAAGYIGGATDELLMRINDMLLVIPGLPLTIILVFVLGQSMINIIIVVGVLGWMGFARTVRSAVLTLKERSFIEAVKSAGGGRGYIIRKHIVPNVFPLIYITLAMSVPSAIVTEAALSWLGLGPLDVMSWGRILHQFEISGTVATNAFNSWYWAFPPGVCIALLSLSFVLIGYALDEILNPRLRER